MVTDGSIYIRLKLNKKVNQKRIYRLMKQLVLKAVIRPKKKRYIKNTPAITADNVLNRQFDEIEANKK